MFEEYYGLGVKIFLASKSTAIGTVTSIDKDGAFICLSQVTFTSPTGQQSFLANYTIEGGQVEDLDILPQQAEEKKEQLLESNPRRQAAGEGKKREAAAAPSSWISVPATVIKGKDFDFEQNLKLFDKEKYTAQQKQKNSQVKSSELSLKSNEMNLKSGELNVKNNELNVKSSELNPKSELSAKDTKVNSKQTPSSAEVNSQLLPKLENLSLGISSLPKELLIENAAIASTLYLLQTRTLKASQLVVKASSKDSEHLLSVCIATARHLLCKASIANATVYLLDELFCYGPQTIAQLKHFHEAGGVIESAAAEFFDSLRLAENDLFFAVGTVADFGGFCGFVDGEAVCLGQVGMVSNFKGTVFVVGKQRISLSGKKNVNAKIVLLNDGTGKGGFYGEVNGEK